MKEKLATGKNYTRKKNCQLQSEEVESTELLLDNTCYLQFNFYFDLENENI